MNTLTEQIKQAVNFIEQAHNVVALTGAGISTPSGIPDFRSPTSGLWDKVDPISVISIESFRRQPQRFYEWVRPLVKVMTTARPNPAHIALAELERRGKLKAIVTQNIDDLHQQAGSKVVYELHGHLREATCTRCYRLHEIAKLAPKFLADGQIPRCDCGGILKPNIIFFGEQLPYREFMAAQVAIKAADLMLVIGSSLEVAPAADLPFLALENQAKLIIINYQTTHLDRHADLVIRADVAKILPKLTILD